MKLDGYDLRILEALQRDGRMTKVKLAEQVHLSPTPCWERLKRLEDSGVIAGYHARIDLRRLATVTEVLVEVTLDRHRHHDFQRFESAVRDIAEIVECHAVGGGVDYLMKVVVPSVDAFQRLMDRLLTSDLGIGRYFSYVVTKPVKSAGELPLRRLLEAQGEGARSDENFSS
ncbi:MAG TPA: Lrp/AsnC family transcriptional regulator [Candidatus Competibacteraceae bacterium]|nr:Lrp/AsnC family transcriptional regulator [Candidatus Competibacteraceae bacterium]